MTQSPKFSGAICPSVIPFDESGKIDFAGLEKHMARLSDSGINGILLSGTIGEFATMSIQERTTLIKEARKMSDLPMIVHISSTVVEDMLRLADVSYDSGYGAVMILPQYYYAQTSRQLLAYYRDLNAKLAGDWLIYNFPARTGCDVDAAIVKELAVECPRFIGIKDTVDCSSHTRTIVRTVLPVRSDFAVFAGFDEYFVPNLMNGGAGVLSGLNNVVPELFAQIKRAFDAGNLSEVAELHKEIGRLSGIYAIGDDFVTTIKTTIARKFGYMKPHSRNYGGQLNQRQLEALDKLFGL
jgi:dihydrodipicolinate synthase/N-acetylneuraminate lyase